MTTHGEENMAGSENQEEAQESLGKQVARTSRLIYLDFKGEGFTGKEAFELTKLWCAPNYSVIVQRMYAEEAAMAKRAAQEKSSGRPRLHLPQH